jgi:hypothetical protein
MRLPNGDRAIVPPEKLTDYCLNPNHPRGRHKARVFAAALGITLEEADQLREALLAAAASEEAAEGENDDFGRRFMIDFIAEGPRGHARVRSRWIVRQGEDVPRLTSCYVL